MSKLIRIDDEVASFLEAAAVEYGLVFGTPNQVLKSILEIDGQSESGGQEMPSSTSYRSSRRLNARRLLAKHNLAAAEAYSHQGGTWFQPISRFPAVLFDPDGYILFRDDRQLAAAPGITVLEKTNVPEGISKIPGYVRCGHSHLDS